MHWDRIQGRWKQMTGQQAMDHWSRLTDGDFYAINGQRDRLAVKIQERYGVTWAEAERQIVEWQRSASETSLGKDRHHA